MGEIQTPAQIATIREVAEAVDYSQFSWPEAALHLCDTVDLLRTRLESAEAALREAQESRFALIIENEELGAELADIRARLESAEAALRKAVGACEMQYAAANHMRGCPVCRVAPSPCKTGAELFLRAADANLAVLGAAGEEKRDG